MKKLYSLFFILIIGSIVCLFSCKKSKVNSLPKEELILGKWSINKIHLNILLNGAVLKDTVLSNTPQPENYVTFKPDGTLEYKFNSASADGGTFHFVGEDSVYATIGGILYRWKTLLLTTQIFNVQNSQAYPQLPGSTIETYQTFVR